MMITIQGTTVAFGHQMSVYDKECKNTIACIATWDVVSEKEQEDEEAPHVEKARV